jgi:hypothetical protein
MRNEWKDLAEKLLFDYGKEVLGKGSGGVIVKLVKERGIDGTRNIIRAASEKSDPMEYVGAAMRDKKTNLQIGEIVGGYRWTGSRWAEST